MPCNVDGLEPHEGHSDDRTVTQADAGTRGSALAMKIIGWGVILGPVIAFAYPPGVLWGEAPGFPSLGPAHPESPLQGLHPYLFMLFAMYAAWAVLMIRGARDPKAHAALFDWGILANLLHAVLMIPMAFVYPNEHAHLWTDVPILLALCVACWVFHPARTARG